jgi:hypothetical protein
MEGVQMTQEEQRIAIAEACGWDYLDSKTIYPRGIKDGVTLELPNYLNNLNAMHEAVMTLNADQMVSMDHHLDVVVGNGKQGLNCEYFLWSATAAQFAKAFLRTIGKWKECK